MKVKCPTCGKRTTLPDEDVGMLALCSACGASYRVTAPQPPPLPIAITDIQAAAAAPQPHHLAGWIALWVGSGLAAMLAITAIAWSLHHWNSRVRAEKFAQANQLKHQTDLLVATGKLDQAQSSLSDLETFVQGSPWPQMRQMAIEARQELAARRLQQFHVVAQAAAKPVLTPPPPVRPAPQEPPDPDTIATNTHADETLKGTEGPYVTNAPHVNVRNIVIHPQRPPVRKVTQVAYGPTDEEIGSAITHGIDYLLERFDPHTYLLPGADDRQGITMGEDILAVYALMQCQQATDDPRLNPHDATMKGLIDAMKGLNLNDYAYETYSRGLRATALALYNRPEDRAILNADATVLVRGSNNGAYTYRPGRNGGRRMMGYDDPTWDNSNSQYGLLGVWAAAETAFEVPDAYWTAVKNHWTRCQNQDGTWDYRMGGGQGTHSMTCAGLASLFVTHDYLDAPAFGVVVGRDPFTPALARGLRWLETGNNAVELNRQGYDLYGLERVGLASGFKFFGNHEWYRELAAQSLAMQRNQRTWGNIVEDAYNLLFLSRGRHPILMNKMRFDGYWANRPRDVANLARFVGYQLERPLNWQVVPLSRDFTDWMDSPILYLSSHKAVNLSESDYDKIRSFVYNGGLLYMQSDGGSEEFTQFARSAAHRLFRDYEMTLLPINSPLCSTVFKTKPDGNLWQVTNGSRIMMLFASEDLSKSWQLRDNKNKPYPFEVGTNLFIYAAGKRDLRNHLVSTYISPVQDSPSVTYSLARLSYNGNWNPEPAAWERFGRWFHLRTGYGLNVTNTPIKQLTIETAPIAELTGTASYDFTAQETEALKKYVEAGGVLLIDLCGGTGPFDKSVQSSLLFKAFAGNASHVMPPSHPMLSSGPDGMEDLGKPLLRPYTIEIMGHANGLGLPEEIAAGKGHVIFTSMDITSALLGTTTWGILGYDPNYAQSLVKNVILWTVDGQNDSPQP